MPTSAYLDDASRSKQLYERALSVMPGGNSRHTVVMKPYPVYAVSGQGCRVTDVEGEERIDFEFVSHDTFVNTMLQVRMVPRNKKNQAE